MQRNVLREADEDGLLIEYIRPTIPTTDKHFGTLTYNLLTRTDGRGQTDADGRRWTRTDGRGRTDADGRTQTDGHEALEPVVRACGA